MWSVEGGYDPIAEQLFTTIACERLLLEYDLLSEQDQRAKLALLGETAAAVWA